MVKEVLTLWDKTWQKFYYSNTEHQITRTDIGGVVSLFSSLENHINQIRDKLDEAETESKISASYVPAICPENQIRRRKRYANDTSSE